MDFILDIVKNNYFALTHAIISTLLSVMCRFDMYYANLLVIVNVIYFVIDLYYIIKHNTKSIIFLLHHIIGLTIITLVMRSQIFLQYYAYCMIVEFSNIFIDLYHIIKIHFPTISKTITNVLKFTFLFTFFATRVLYIPYLWYHVHILNDYKYDMLFVIIAVLYSMQLYWFSIMIKIFIGLITGKGKKIE